MDCHSVIIHIPIRLSEFLALIACLLLAVPLAMSAPSGRPIWINPCGSRESAVDGQAAEVIPDDQLLTRIVTASKNALAYARQFSEDFVGNTFPGNTLQTHHKLWKDVRYDWLPSKQEIPKTLGEDTPESHLKQLADLELDVFLLNAFRYLQTISVGLEQIHHDKSRQNALFAEEFNQAQYKLRQVLCEVESAIIAKSAGERIIDVTRNVMSDDIRFVDQETHRNMRDWIIFRDYMNCLEYVVNVCEYLNSIKEGA